MLSDFGLMAAMDRGEIDIDPCTAMNFQPASVDLTLSPVFRRVSGITTITVSDVPPRYMLEPETCEPGGYIELKPDEFVLASTRERIRLSSWYAARVEGRSSLGRLGLMNHVTAGFIDPGFDGEITLELKNVAPWRIRLCPLMRIAQISFFRLDSPPALVYGQEVGHYSGQIGPTPTRTGDIT